MTDQEALIWLNEMSSVQPILTNIACLPVDKWKSHVETACKWRIDTSECGITADVILEENKEVMLLKNRRMTLAVDPHGKDESGYACVVGSIRLRELGKRIPGHDLAEQCLGYEMAKEVGRNESKLIDSIAYLSKEPVGTNPYYEVCVAGLLQIG